MQDLGTLGGNCAIANYINERGQVAGASDTTTTPNRATGIPTQDPFLWEDGKMTDLGTLGGAIGFPLVLNNHGQVSGLSSTSANPGACLTEGDPNCHPFLWDHGRLIDLNTSTIGGNPLSVDGFNDAGEIVGAADFSTTGGSPFDAYLWINGVATDLGAVSGDCFSRANAINSHAQVVGSSFSCDGNFDRAFLWDNGSIVDLNAQIPAHSHLQLVGVAPEINDRGEIAGMGVPPGVDPNNVTTQGHAFLLIPCDRDRSDDEGCEDENSTGVTQNSPAPATHDFVPDGTSGTTFPAPKRGQRISRAGLAPWARLCRRFAAPKARASPIRASICIPLANFGTMTLAMRQAQRCRYTSMAAP